MVLERMAGSEWLCGLPTTTRQLFPAAHFPPIILYQSGLKKRSNIFSPLDKLERTVYKHFTVRVGKREYIPERGCVRHAESPTRNNTGEHARWWRDVRVGRTDP